MFSLIRIAAPLPVFATIQKKDHNFFAYTMITVSKSYNNFIAIAKELSAVLNWNVLLFHRWLGRRMNQNYWIHKKDGVWSDFIYQHPKIFFFYCLHSSYWQLTCTAVSGMQSIHLLTCQGV